MLHSRSLLVIHCKYSSVHMSIKLWERVFWPLSFPKKHLRGHWQKAVEQQWCGLPISSSFFFSLLRPACIFFSLLIKHFVVYFFIFYFFTLQYCIGFAIHWFSSKGAIVLSSDLRTGLLKTFPLKKEFCGPVYLKSLWGGIIQLGHSEYLRNYLEKLGNKRNKK